MNDNLRELPPGWRPMSEPPKLVRRRVSTAGLKYFPEWKQELLKKQDVVLDEIPVLIAYRFEPLSFEPGPVEYACWPARYMLLKSKRKPMWVCIENDDEAPDLSDAIAWRPMPSPFEFRS